MKRTLADYYMSLNARDKEAFRKVFRSCGGTTTETESKVQTVAEYIATHDVKTERRTSGKGTELIKVYYENGTVKEYPIEHIERTHAFYKKYF